MNESVFQIVPVEADWRSDSAAVIEGDHQWKIPSISCPKCGVVWGESAVVYPWIDLRSLSGLRLQRYRSDKVCVLPPAELDEAMKPVRQALPGYPLLPGTALGQFDGKCSSGRLCDFHFDLELRLVSRKGFESLRESGARNIAASPARIRSRRSGDMDYLELHFVPRARSIMPKVQKPGEDYCSECDFDQRSLPETIAISRESIPADEDLFQLVDEPSVTLAKSCFVERVAQLGLTGLDFRPVQVD